MVFPPFFGEKIMQTTLQISRKERALFELTCCVDEVRALKHELTIQEISQVVRVLKTLCSAIHETQHQTQHQISRQRFF